MKNCVLALFLCLSTLAANGQKWRAGQEPPQRPKPGVDYPVSIHISGIHLRTEYEGQGIFYSLVYADATMDGKKIELCLPLEPYPGHHVDPVLPGDYKARLLKESPKKDAYKTSDPQIGRQYELVMPDGFVLGSMVTGVAQ